MFYILCHTFKTTKINNSIVNSHKENSILKAVVFGGSNFREFRKFGRISTKLIFANFLGKSNLEKLILGKKLNNQISSFLNIWQRRS